MRLYDDAAPSNNHFSQDEQIDQHRSYIFHICYELTDAPSAPFRFLSALSLVEDFAKPGPVKIYDRWLAKTMSPMPNDKESVEALMRDYRNDRRSIFRWQESDRGLLLLDGKLITLQHLEGRRESYYLYEFPFMGLVRKVWDKTNTTMFTTQMKDIAIKEFDQIYPERGLMEPLGKQEQSLEEMRARTASMVATLIDRYGEKYRELGLDGILSMMAGEMNEDLELKGKPPVFKDPLNLDEARKSFK